MSKEIKELDKTKYLVLKWDDINQLQEDCIDKLNDIIQQIHEYRISEGKKDNSYVVLNLDDEISVYNLIGRLEDTREKHIIKIRNSLKEDRQPMKVKDIAVDLVNAILKAKE